MLCSEPIQRRRPSAASTKGGGLRPPPFVDSFVLALNNAHVLALNTAHVSRLNKADVLALNKAHVLRFKNKICPVSKQKPEIFTTMKSLSVDLVHFRAQRPSCSLENGAWKIERGSEPIYK